MEASFSNQQIGDFYIQEIIRRRAAIDMYRATQTSLRRLVLVKIILFSTITETDQVSMDEFQTHIRKVLALEHLHLQPIYTYGVLDDNYFYIAGRMIAGSLSDLLVAGALPLEQTYVLALQLASALSFIHANHLVHKSISPQNVYIGEDQNIYLNDLELAPFVQSVNSLAELAAVLDEPFYASVEQLELQTLDVRSEIYGFGAVLYHMAAGVAPFFDEDNSFEKVLERKLKSQLRLPRQVNAAVPPQLEAVILRALELRPERRFQDVESMERALIELGAEAILSSSAVHPNSWLENLKRFLSGR